MPVEVISLLSSPEQRALAAPQSVSLRSEKNGAILQADSGARHLDEVKDKVWILSNDFDSPVDLASGDDDGMCNDRPPKRPRLSHHSQDEPLRPVTSTTRRTTGFALALDSSSPYQKDQCLSRAADFQDRSRLHSSAQMETRRRDKSSVHDLTDMAEFDLGSDLPRRKLQSQKSLAAWDPISSSAPEPGGGDAVPSSPPNRALHRSRSEVILIDDSDADLHASSSEDELPNLSQVRAGKRAVQGSRSLQGSRATQSLNRAPPTKRTAEERAREKEVREAEKERKKREKEQERERKAAEKKQAAALAEVNKVRTDKKVSTPEMIVDFPTSLRDTIKSQAEVLLSDLNVTCDSYSSPVPNVVKWRRKVRAVRNEELDQWDPIPERIEPEKHAMVVITAAELVGLILASDGESTSNNDDTSPTGLDRHVASMRQHYSNHTVIYLLEGYETWKSKNRTIRNRQFGAAVRNAPSSEAQPPPPSADTAVPSRRRKAPAAAAVYVDQDLIDDGLLKLQVRHGALIHETKTPLETAQQIAVLTQHISTIPYRRQRDAANDAAGAFCMESGQVRVGDGPRDTYVRLLQEVARLTAPVAYGVAAEFGSVAELVRGLEAGGPLCLEDVRKGANKDGAFSDRRLGPALSRRLYKVFTGRDERSMDI